MAEEEAPFLPGAEDSDEGIEISFRPRRQFAGYKAFGNGEGAVLLEPRVARELRNAAEFATQERRVTGGLLYGRGYLDDQGAYLVINGFIEAGPGENSGDRLSSDGADAFTLSEADLRLLREDAARMYSASLELGWWRTRADLGDFGPDDYLTQAELIGPDGVGLLVYGSGVHWGTAYLGPDGHAPNSAGTLVEAPEAAPVLADPGPADPGPPLVAEAPLAPEPELVDIAAGQGLRRDVPTAPPGRARSGMSTRVRVPSRVRVWGPRPAGGVRSGPETPADVQFVVVALAIVMIAAAIIIGFLVHSVVVAVIIAAVGLLAVFSTVWFARR
jgi:hypothetical protein